MGSITKAKIKYDMESLAKKNAFQVLYDYAISHPRDIALIYSADLNVKDKSRAVLKKKITYNELIRNILNSYYNLIENGVEKGDTVIFSSITTPELIYTCYACIILGAKFKAIDVRFSSDELLKSFKQSPAKLFFFMEKFVDRVLPIYKDLNVNKLVSLSGTESLPTIPRICSKIISKNVSTEGLCKNSLFEPWEKYNRRNSNLTIPKEQSAPDDIINLSATTGSTGAPKPVMHDNNNWNSQVYQANTLLPLYMGDRFYNCSVPWVSFGLPIGVHVYLCHGITIDMDPLWTQELNPYYIIKKDPNWWMGAPGWLDPLFTDHKFQDVKLKNTVAFVCGGAPLFANKHHLYQDRLDMMTSGNKIKAHIYPGYGLTETTAPIAHNDGSYSYGANGEVWPLIDVKIVNPQTGVELEDGQTGHLLLRSNQEVFSPIFRGYQNMACETNNAFENGWFKTGDLCKVIDRKNGRPVLGEVTRIKNILTYNGYNIDCDKICEIITDSGLAREVDVIRSITADGNEAPLICIVPEFDDENIKEKIYNLLRSKCPSYYVYAGIEVLNELPKISMKIDKQKLKKMFLDSNGVYSKR